MKTKPIFFLAVLVLGGGLACGPDESQAESTSLFINEIMPVNSAVIADDFGEYDDWIELYNAAARRSAWRAISSATTTSTCTRSGCRRAHH